MKGSCLYIPKYLDPIIGINQPCTYELLKKKDRKPLIKKCTSKSIIKELERKDKELKRNCARKNIEHNL